MEAVFGLLLMLLGVSQGVELHCDGRQEGAQCYGALGGTVVLRLMDNTSQIHWFTWENKAGTILHWRNKRIVFNQIEHRSVFTPSDGTFRINNLNRTDSGNYTLEIFDSNGVRTAQRTLQLTIQAPVSSVLLVSECLSQGEMRVSCSSEGGDSPQYSWTLDGHTLTDTQLLFGSKETNNITLKQDVSGKLVCSGSNHISNVSEEENISTCGFIHIDCILPNGTHISQWVSAANNTLCIQPTTTYTTIPTETGNTNKFNTSSNQTGTAPSKDKPWYIRNLPIIAGVISALVFLLVVVVVVFCTQKKKQNQKQKEEVDEQELTYADVRVFQRQGRQQMPQRAENEVEYGQVKFSEGPRRTVEPAEECVYAKVRRDR